MAETSLLIRSIKSSPSWISGPALLAAWVVMPPAAALWTDSSCAPPLLIQFPQPFFSQLPDCDESVPVPACAVWDLAPPAIWNFSISESRSSTRDCRSVQLCSLSFSFCSTSARFRCSWRTAFFRMSLWDLMWKAMSEFSLFSSHLYDVGQSFFSHERDPWNAHCLQNLCEVCLIFGLTLVSRWGPPCGWKVPR